MNTSVELGMRIFSPFFVLLLAFGILLISVNAQVKRKPIVTPSPITTPTPQPKLTPKKNERPSSTAKIADEPHASSSRYSYEFSRPGFVLSPVKITHDETGKGTITFKKLQYDEEITDPVELSSATLERLNAAFTALNFVQSSEDYQYERDFTNLGNITISLQLGNRGRTAKYNWTSNKDAKILMDEYRKIGWEYVWRFEIALARENQPLLAPGLMSELESYLRHHEISDPPHLIPFLKTLSSDERVPLMARNRATDAIAQIEKAAKKANKTTSQ